MNIKMCERLVGELNKQGITEFILCPGARNAPLVEVLSKCSGGKVYYFFDERSAGFFALGRIQRTHRPVAVVTTSGTAVAELLPAVVEASYTSSPLVVVSADRPKNYRGSGAPQAIEHVGIFSSYIKKCFDWDEPGGILLPEPINSPTHINICFDEPLVDKEIQPFDLTREAPAENSTSWTTLQDLTQRVKGFCESSQRPLIILGALPQSTRESVAKLLKYLKLPVYAEGPSGLRETQFLSEQVFKSGEKILSGLLEEKLFDGVLRIGGVPTCRFWRDLEKKWIHIPVLSISHTPYSGLSRDSNPPLNLPFFLDLCEKKSISMQFRGAHSETIEPVMAQDRVAREQLTKLLMSEPQSEPSQIFMLSQKMEEGSQVFLGNSWPIREWDLCAAFDPRKNFEVMANRGANGIDGLISTFMGWSSDDKPNWGLFGDISTLYDMQSLWALGQLRQRPLRIVVINNSGGQIFSRLFKNKAFLNEHHLDFRSWAEMFKVPYLTSRELGDNLELPMGAVVIELTPDNQASQRFWQAWQ